MTNKLQISSQIWHIATIQNVEITIGSSFIAE